VNRLLLKIKRGETPLYRAIRRVAKAIILPSAPRVPGFLKPALRLLYEFHYLVIIFFRMLLNVFYRNPLFQSRCATFGKNVSVDDLPFVSGHVEIHIGDNVYLGGKISIMSGRVCEQPRLIIKDNAEINWNVMITVNQEVVVEEYARVSFDCRISDSDTHPRDAELRARHQPADPRDVKPVRIGKHAWIGNGTHIMKGVTIGEGAIIGANSVVITDIPPYCLALGNPAEVYFRNIGRSKRSRGTSTPPAQTAAER
jgi:acetyltransferase-like isoleucine patch superfamily enzyme